MQVQSAADPPKKVAQGERPVAADGGEYLPLQMIATGAPLALVYPSEGTPSIPGGAGIMVDAPHPNAARRIRDLPVLARRAAVAERYGADALVPSRREDAGRHEAAVRDQGR